MGTTISLFVKSTLAAAVPFFLLGIGLATWQIWALAASCFSGSMIGLFHLYKVVRMVREDLKAGNKFNLRRYIKKQKHESDK